VPVWQVVYATLRARDAAGAAPIALAIRFVAAGTGAVRPRQRSRAAPVRACTTDALGIRTVAGHRAGTAGAAVLAAGLAPTRDAPAVRNAARARARAARFTPLPAVPGLAILAGADATDTLHIVAVATRAIAAWPADRSAWAADVRITEQLGVVVPMRAAAVGAAGPTRTTRELTEVSDRTRGIRPASRRRTCRTAAKPRTACAASERREARIDVLTALDAGLVFARLMLASDVVAFASRDRLGLARGAAAVRVLAGLARAIVLSRRRDVVAEPERGPNACHRDESSTAAPTVAQPAPARSVLSTALIFPIVSARVAMARSNITGDIASPASETKSIRR
jgi:hypothetical protein